MTGDYKSKGRRILMTNVCAALRHAWQQSKRTSNTW